MNGVLNIQTRVLTAQAQAALKQLEKEIAAVDRATNGQTAAQKNLSVAQEHNRNVTRALSAAYKELAAAEKAAAGSAGAIVAAEKAATAATHANTQALGKLAIAEANVKALRQGGLAAQARAQNLTMRQKAANDALKIANINLAAAQRRVAEVTAAQNSNNSALNGSTNALTAAQEALTKAEIRQAAAKRRQILVGNVSAKIRNEARLAAKALAIAELQLADAEHKATVAAAAKNAALARVTVTEAEATAATQRLTAANAALAKAQQNAAVSAAALRNAQAAGSAATAAGAGAAAAAAGGGFAAATNGMRKFGSQTQWAGRQLTTNFGIPVLIAGGLATKWALENEKSMTRVSKVYGELGMDITQKQKELEQLGRAFTALSNHFGVHQKEVIDIAASWAAAGASGVGLARSVRNTLTIMSLGEMEAAEATSALIALQSQYNINSKDLTKTIAQLNIVENQTGASLRDLIQGFSRAAGVAKTAGIDTRHLSAYIAGLVPTAGTATNAGNALKTMIARLFAPTNSARDVLEKMNIQVDAMSWKSATGAERIETVSKAFWKLDSSQRATAASYLAGNFQISRFVTLMEQVRGNTHDATQELSQYQRAMNATANEAAYLVQAEQELNAVLESNPQKLKQIMVILQNSMASAIQPAIPAIIMLAAMIQKAFEAFQNLPPGVRKAIIAFVLFAATLGIVLRLVGTFILLFAYMAKIVRVLAFAVIFLGKAIWMRLVLPLVAALAAISPIGWAVIAVVAVVTVAIMKIPGVMEKVRNSIASAFNALPQSIQDAMMTVVRIVQAAVQAVYTLFSYLNPFAHHSPSLVENVTKGMAVVTSEFAKITNIGPPIRKAYKDIKLFKDATADLRAGFDSVKRAQDFKDLMKVDPDAADEFRALVADLKVLNPILDQLTDQLDAQQRVVDGWRDKLDAANDALDVQKEKLEKLQEVARGWSDLLSQAEDDLSRFASAPLTGTRAMEDQIFANEMAQKALRLEMMNLEDVAGPIDDLRDRMAALNGDIEVLRGTQADLRGAGAGSDVLATYDAQIAALEAQKQSVNETASEYNQLEDQLANLERIGQRLDLEKSLNFDGLNRQIDQAANSLEEMPFEQIMAGVANAKARIDEYSAALGVANSKVDEQQKLVDKAQQKYDAINASYERQADKLEVIRERYDQVKKAVDDVTAALDEMVSAAQGVEKKASGEYVSNAAKNMESAKGGNFPDAAGKGGIGRETDMDIDAWTKQLQDETKALGDRIDIFKPLRDGWWKFKSWWASNVTGPIKNLFTDLVPGTDNISLSGSHAKYIDSEFKNQLDGMADTFKNAFKSDAMKSVGNGIEAVFRGIGEVIRLYWPDIKDLIDVFKDAGVKAFKTIWPELQRMGKAFKDVWIAIEPLRNILMVVAAAIGGWILLKWKVFASILTEVVGRALDFIIDIIGDVLRVFTGVVQLIGGILSGDWTLMWEGAKNIVMGIFEAIWHVIEGFVSIIWGVIKGFVEGVVGFFTWLWDVLVGHSIIPDMVNAIVKWFLSLPGKILSALAALGGKLVDLIKAAWALFMSALKTAWNGTFEFIKSLPGKIFDGFMLYVGLITSIGSKIIGWIKTGLVNAWEKISGWVGEKIDWVVEKFGSIKSSLASKFSGMFDGIKDAFRGAINFIIRGWNGIEFKIPGFKVGPVGYDGFTLGLPDIPELARGGIARGGKLHLVGERGPEFFVPNRTGTVGTNDALQRILSSEIARMTSTFRPTTLGETVKATNPAALGGTVARADARVSGADQPAQVVQSQTVNNRTEYHFHGDLSFPNITSGDDADKFLSNLSDLAG